MVCVGSGTGTCYTSSYESQKAKKRYTSEKKQEKVARTGEWPAKSEQKHINNSRTAKTAIRKTKLAKEKKICVGRPQKYVLTLISVAGG